MNYKSQNDFLDAYLLTWFSDEALIEQEIAKKKTMSMSNNLIQNRFGE
jgi:hypothetical protein